MTLSTCGSKERNGWEKRYIESFPRELSYDTAFCEFGGQCERLIATNGLREVCEVGAGRFPLFEPNQVRALGIKYTINDVSNEQLDFAPPGYTKLCLDICQALPRDLYGNFDFIFTKTVAEHVPSGDAMHRNIHLMLKPGGIAFHFFPTLYYPPYLLNARLPEFLGRPIVRWLLHRDIKFRAYYSMCLGPSARMRRFLEGIGYQILEFRPFYGAGYLRRVPVLRAVERNLSQWAARRRNPFLSSFAYLTLRKPRRVSAAEQTST